MVRFSIVRDVLIAGSTVLMIASAPFQRRFRNRRLLPAAVAGSLLAVYGLLGWFGCFLSVDGAFDGLPRSFEWPMGNPDGIITMPDGSHVVPHPPSGRIQVYDDRWRFVRGWPVKAGGGDFTLFPSGSDRVEMICTRGSVRYTYLVSGDLVARETYPPVRFSSFPNPGKRFVVPTAPWLWVLSSPGLSLVIASMGVGVLALTDWLARRAAA